MSEALDAKKMRSLNDEELRLRAAEILRDLFQMRIKSATKELVQSHHIRAKRREYARLMTVLGQRRRDAAKKEKS